MNKKCLSLLFGWIAALSVSTGVSAAYPEKPVKIVVGFTPGGTADTVARLLAVSLGERMGQPFIVENRSGANGMIATDAVARSAPDGYTLFFTSIGHAVNPSLYKLAKYDPVKSFTPIGQVLSAPNVLVVPGNSPFNSVAELVTFAKNNPGKLNYASSGSGTSVHLSAELFNLQAGIDVVHVPYKGTGSLLPDLMSGAVDMAFPNLPTALIFIQSGKLKALGVTTAKRSDAAPEIPSLSEVGVPGYDMSTWYGLIGPADMPADVVKLLNEQLGAVLNDPEVRGKMVAQGVDPIYSSPEQFAAFIQNEADKWADLLKKVKIEVQ